MFDILEQANDTAPLALGMIPAWIMKSFETNLRTKIIELNAAKLKCTVEDVTPHISEERIREVMRPIVRAVSSELYRVAKEKGVMVV
jgi:hypothetical protein